MGSASIMVGGDMNNDASSYFCIAAYQVLAIFKYMNGTFETLATAGYAYWDWAAFRVVDDSPQLNVYYALRCTVEKMNDGVMVTAEININNRKKTVSVMDSGFHSLDVNEFESLLTTIGFYNSAANVSAK